MEGQGLPWEGAPAVVAAASGGSFPEQCTSCHPPQPL